MPKKTTDRERLLAETYHGEWSTGPAAAFARNAALSARRRRTFRSALKSSSIAALLLVAALAITSHRAPTPIAHSTSPPRPSPSPAYEIISDTELLALVQDRPLLLIQNNTASGSSRQILTFDY